MSKPQYKLAIEYLQSNGFVIKERQGWANCQYSVGHPKMNNDNFRRFRLSFHDLKNIATKVQINELWGVSKDNPVYFDWLFTNTYGFNVDNKVLIFYGAKDPLFPILPNIQSLINDCKILSDNIEKRINITSIKMMCNLKEEVIFTHIDDEKDQSSIMYQYESREQELSTATTFNDKFKFPGILTRKEYYKKLDKLKSFV